MPDGIVHGLKKIGHFIREEAPKFKAFIGKEIHVIEAKLSSAKNNLESELAKHSEYRERESSGNLTDYERDDYRRLENRISELSNMIKEYEHELHGARMVERIPEAPHMINEIILQMPYANEAEKLKEVI
jgi:hypothetical protein